MWREEFDAIRSDHIFLYAPDYADIGGKRCRLIDRDVCPSSSGLYMDGK